jgi:CheY-like chemotaxis protein
VNTLPTATTKPEPPGAVEPSVEDLANEFRTALRSVKELVALVHTGRAGRLNARQSEYLGMAADRIDEMLDAAGLVSGRLAVWRRKTTPRTILDAAGASLRRKAVTRNVALEISLDANLPPLFCDPEITGRAIVRLAGCAIVSSTPGSRVALRAQADEERSGVLFSVEPIDHGNDSAGEISARFASELLAARDLARLSFGEVGVECRAESGTAFSLTIPRLKWRELADRFIADLDRRRQRPSSVALAVAELKPSPAPATADLADEFLQRVFRWTDLVLPVSPAKWLVAAVCAERETVAVFRRVENAWAEIAENRPGEPLPKIGFCTRGVWDLEAGMGEFSESFHVELERVQQRPQAPRILVVEDDRELLQGLELRLHAAGYDVITATDGRSAIDSAIEHHPHAILMDNYMPGMDGLKAMGHLGELPDTKDIPIIMLSASVRDQQKALRQGARFFLQKPCSATTIVAALDDLIKEPARASAK